MRIITLLLILATAVIQKPEPAITTGAVNCSGGKLEVTAYCPENVPLRVKCIERRPVAWCGEGEMPPRRRDRE